MGNPVIPVFGPNDFNMAGGTLEPGLGDQEEAVIRRARGHVRLEEPPAKAALRKEADELKAKARQLSTVERELAKERESMEADLAKREADLVEREALVAKQLKDLEG